jgi:AMP phosphorylase
MKLKIRKLGFLAGMPVCIIHEGTLREMNLHIGNRVCISKGKKSIIAIVDGMSRVLKHNEIAVSEVIIHSLKLKNKEFVNIEIAEKPHSIALIKKKLLGEKLTKKEIFEIVGNIASNALTEAEVAFFVSAVFSEGMNLRETKDLILAMVNSGGRMNLRGKIVDKHSIGGIAGNRTTPIIVSICASTGLKMPKTSSRAITSAAGTADSIEAIAKVNFSVKDIKKIIKKTNACFVWGGGLGLAPVDDKIIRIERIANVDSTSQLLASILSKKISADSKYVLIDIPYGKGAKVNRKQANNLKEKFLELSKMFDIHLEAVLTDGNEPIGRGIGPGLEIIDVLKVLERKKDAPQDLEEKSIFLAGKLLELAGKAKKGYGIEKALKILNSGKALQKFKDIIKAQKGSLDKIPKSRFSYDIKTKRKITIRHLDNKFINRLARITGCPDDKAAGLFLHKKKGDTAKKGDVLITLYAVSKDKLEHAKKFFKKNEKLIMEVRH